MKPSNLVRLEAAGASEDVDEDLLLERGTDFNLARISSPVPWRIRLRDENFGDPDPPGGSSGYLIAERQTRTTSESVGGVYGEMSICPKARATPCP